MHDFKQLVFVGIDPHKYQHTAVMIDHWGEVFFELDFPNQPKGFEELLRTVNMHTPTGRIAIFGIEDTGGFGRPCAQWLTSEGLLVKGVNPVMSCSQRKRRPHKDKSDADDAAAVAKVVIAEFSTLPEVKKDDYYHALRQLVNRREQLVKTSTQCKNRLHKLLYEHYPEYKEFFSDSFGVTSLAFWHKYPHPSLLENIGPKRLGSFLQKHARNFSTSKAEHILSLVDKNQAMSIETEICISVIKQLVEQLQQLQTHIEEIEGLISGMLKQSDTHLNTLPGVGDITAASILSRVGPIERFSSASKLARHAGISPEENSSGRTTRQQRSKSGDRQLNAAIHRIALNQIGVCKNGTHRCPIAYEYYQRKISEGKTKLSALTCLKRRLCDIIYAMLRDKSNYIEPELKDEQELSVA